ncbi:hypothetical protein AUK10_01655 [Candidatus Gracilibacteria bacterium CG2_30_37_12]|nr:MAG: hypothetical protein AUK10_01655 [Candidatus Gracilibacteria bacterium CG2_30_37_12]
MIKLAKNDQDRIAVTNTLHEVCEAEKAYIQEHKNNNETITAVEFQQSFIDTIPPLIEQPSKLSRLKSQVGIAFLGVVVGATGATIYEQVVPESGLKKWVSGSVEKVFGDSDTGYNRIQEGEKSIGVIKEQVQELKRVQRLNDIQKEIITLQERIAKNNELIALPDKQKKDIGGVDISPNESNNLKTIQKKTQNTDVYNSTLFADVKSIRDEVVKEFPTSLQVKLREDKGGRVLVYVEYNGKKSLGFYADSPKFKNRLTEVGMRKWVADSIYQLTQVEEIESIAHQHGISTSLDSPISMKVKKMYSGNIIITFHDFNKNKIAKYTIGPKDKNPDIAHKINDTLNKFLPPIPHIL